MNEVWQDGYNDAMYHISFFHRVNDMLKIPFTSWHPYTNIPFSIDKNILTFTLMPMFNDFILDKIYLEFPNYLLEQNTVLDISINDKSVSFQQNINVISINKPAKVFQKVVLIFGQTPTINKLCATLLQFTKDITYLPSPQYFATGRKYNFGPFSQSTFDSKFIPKNFCIRKIRLREPTNFLITSNNSYLYHFKDSDAHLTRTGDMYQVKLKCDFPIFHASMIKFVCSTEFYLRGVINSNGKAQEMLDQTSTKFVTETTRMLRFDASSFKMDNRDFGGELFLKHMIVQCDTGSFVGTIAMRMVPNYDGNLIWDDVINYGSNGWITSVIENKESTLKSNQIILPFSANPKSILPHSYLFLNRCDSFQILLRTNQQTPKITVKLYCLQVVQYHSGQLGQVFGC